MVDGNETSLEAILRESIRRLRDAGGADPGLDARLLVEQLTGASRTQMLTEPASPVSGAIGDRIRRAVARRAAGEPLYRILGFRPFYGLDLMLSPATLEPRPDTETVVDAMLPPVRAIVAQKGKCRILDLGTGTGAIALALLHQAPAATATGVDRSQAALDTARENAIRLGMGDRFSALRSDWFERVSGSWDVIVSNPPYIRRSEIDDLDAEVRDHDPLLALDGGNDGLDAYRRIAAGAMLVLEDAGLVGLEIGFDQRNDVSDIFARNGFDFMSAHRDLSGHDRVLIFGRA